MLRAAGKVCLGCISETVKCRKLILGTTKLVGTLVGGAGVQRHGVTLIRL